MTRPLVTTISVLLLGLGCSLVRADDPVTHPVDTLTTLEPSLEEAGFWKGTLDPTGWDDCEPEQALGFNSEGKKICITLGPTAQEQIDALRKRVAVLECYHDYWTRPGWTDMDVGSDPCSAAGEVK